jgi:quercetin dioxygenase-like cupin family protein
LKGNDAARSILKVVKGGRMSGKDEIRLGGIAVRFLVEGKDSGNSVAMFEFDVAAGAKVPAAHSHDGFDETAYMLKGRLTFTLGGETGERGPGEVLYIPRGVVHRFDNLSGEDAAALAVITPGVLGPEYFQEIREVMKAAAGGPPDGRALGEVMRRHGLTPVP